MITMLNDHNSRYTGSYKTGLIFGKFYPLHRGHIYLIEKALNEVDELHVILGCEATRDQTLYEQSQLSRQPQVKDRLYWLQHTFRHQHSVYIHCLDESGISFYPNGWQEWSDRVKQLLASAHIKPTLIFTSESQDVAQHQHYFQCSARLIDVERHFVPISATEIRRDPYANWSFIAKAAQPFFVKKVALIGDAEFNEFSKQLANIYNTEYVLDGYNYYISRTLNNSHDFLSEKDYVQLALMHKERLMAATLKANQLLFTNINFEVFNHYFLQKFASVNPVLSELVEHCPFDLVIKQTELPAGLTKNQQFDALLLQVQQLLQPTPVQGG